MNRKQKLAGPLRFFEGALLLSALALLGWCAVILAEGRAAQAYGEWSLERMRHGRSASRLEFVVDRFVPSSLQSWLESRGGTATTKDDTKSAPLKPGTLVGRIEIPRLHVRAIVMEGDADDTLRLGVGHIPGTPLPGQLGNAAIAGHRDSFFHRLSRIRRSDRISIVTPDNTYRYAVDSIRIVAPEKIDVLAPTPTPTLTLVTCYPFDFIGAAPSRFIVSAHRLDPQ